MRQLQRVRTGTVTLRRTAAPVPRSKPLLHIAHWHRNLGLRETNTHRIWTAVRNGETTPEPTSRVRNKEPRRIHNHDGIDPSLSPYPMIQ